MRVSVITHGCKMNQYESELIIEMLENAGYVVLYGEDQGAEVYILNSCAVTGEAERKVRQAVRHLRKLNPDAKIILTGCYVQVPRAIEEYSSLGVDLVLGNLEKKRILNFINEVGGYFNSRYWEEDDISFEIVENSVTERSRAFVKVEDGCNNGCTYCVIRSLRGTRIRSKPIEVVVKEIEKLVSKRHKEIVITGLNLGKYGVDLGVNLAELLQKIASIEGDFRIRLSSINPEDLTDELIKVITQEERICNHLHIPAQSGSTSVLRRMGRNYSAEYFIERVNKLRQIDPFFSITTDIMVGFPGETEEEFKETLDFVRTIQFSKVHTFRYSQRPNTPAARFENQVPGNVKKDRAEILIKHADNVANEYRKQLVGKTTVVLVEGVQNGIAYGYDEYYLFHEINTGIIGEFSKVKICSVTNEGVVSKVVQKQASNE
ncbi:threonylcarbamoyladenosine tRNA methylthiotransferase MtaB [Fervidobacterium changbaicum]|uniref:tRNA (N(6)-L-threonylcarbamoyladenosine(37)-C(2))-methylthiotransferase MtaB n=2 Tax=Fervidobacterium TaxID=2422 RepID=A0AAI8GD89_FERIS|nr:MULTISPECIES: tRNA (N(6)-L-threonylcarbamoyladenosine(37)-C(2))-methylthiotransferase MtaB [Fervidobacterium]AMW32764.1 tRNA (N(6)-L-threonylcarbamoyladenosine(37)-C(2))-methylthiotransferase MtaB [Fervidobacterium islandicum]QAV32797.1 tRNA (N(6)-L-threonylcarbamoyladenosine(37)-C(2))-methylthiotransferase MtaB [Fervidobacterium changbaicum]SDG95138.1 threonylcarbamoyladenosine tRNA methylthiotransferase MtaB [Fervidobacterium changbaicum]